MNKSASFAIVIVGLLSLRCGLLASPAVATFVGGADDLVNLSLPWLTVGAICVVAGALGIFYRRLF